MMILGGYMSRAIKKEQEEGLENPALNEGK